MSKLLDDKKISSKLTHTPREHHDTHKGQAHFAGTGPRGATCRECQHWAFAGKYRDYDGLITPVCCDKFKSLNRGKPGAAVPDHAPSCRHFINNPKPPERYHRK